MVKVIQADVPIPLVVNVTPVLVLFILHWINDRITERLLQV